MSSSDIYEVKESPWAKKAQPPESQQRRRSRRSRETFDDVVNKDISGTHRRRSHNSGFRRFRHLMKRPEFNKKFWVTSLTIFGIIIGGLLVWDRFFRYPSQPNGYKESVPRPLLK